MPARENQIVVYQPNETVRLDVRLENETVWLTQEQMSLLFGRDQSVIARHIGNIFKEGELDRISVHAKNAYTAADGKTYQVSFYNLDVVISVGYRVKSIQGTRFRQWATGVLKDYLLRGYSINARLNQLEDKVDRRLAKTEADIAELKDKVDFFVQTKEPPLQEIFYQGKFWDAKEEIFWTGASLKDAGRLTFAAAQMGAEVIPGLLESIRKATTEIIVYPNSKVAATTKGASSRR